MGITDTKKTKDYICEYLSDLHPVDCKALMGKTIKHIHAREYSLTIIFTDDSELEVSGHTYSGCSLDVELKEKVQL